MTFRAGFLRSALYWLLCLVLSGCLPAGSGPLDEEKEPHFLAGKSRALSLDFNGAIESFEKALQVNPQSASAHFELACIFDQRQIDPAAAIYHYDHYLKLKANAGNPASNADIVKQRMMACKQALAESVSFGPVTEKIQRQCEQVAEENKRLTDENKQLRAELEKWSGYAARLQTLTNQGAAASTAPAVKAIPLAQTQTPVLAQVSSVAGNASISSARTTNRTHTVKAGDTPSLIARKYGVKLDALMAANPNLDPRRLRVGQVLRIPGA